MKKRNKFPLIQGNNPVAKFAHLFNNAHTFEDKTKYRRNTKHKKQEVSLILLNSMISEAACLTTAGFRLF